MIINYAAAQDLMVAVVQTAIDDVVRWEMYKRHPREIGEGYIRRMEYDAEMAMRFLTNDERVQMYTNYDSARLLQFVAKKIEYEEEKCKDT